MAKPDPAVLDPVRYPFHCTTSTRFGDLDTNMHLNNVALAGIVEDGRVRFHHASGFHAALGGMSAMVASFTIEFLAQAWYPQPLDVYGAVAHTGERSFILYQLLRQEDRIVSFAQTVMVCVADHRSVALPSAFVAGLEPWRLRP